MDPVSYQRMEERMEREKCIAAVKEGLTDIDEGRVRAIENVYMDMKTNYGLA